MSALSDFQAHFRREYLSLTPDFFHSLPTDQLLTFLESNNTYHSRALDGGMYALGNGDYFYVQVPDSYMCGEFKAQFEELEFYDPLLSKMYSDDAERLFEYKADNTKIWNWFTLDVALNFLNSLANGASRIELGEIVILEDCIYLPDNCKIIDDDVHSYRKEVSTSYHNYLDEVVSYIIVGIALLEFQSRNNGKGYRPDEVHKS